MTTLPFERSYWVVPRKLLAGCYPGAPETAEARAKLTGILDVGIRTSIDLTEAFETDHYGRGFVPYAPVITRLARMRGCAFECLRFPIADMDVPDHERMREILDAIDARIAADTPVYVHCWGGYGRTGTVVGCWLARHGVAAGDAVFGKIRELRSALTGASPQTEAQRAMVRNWTDGR
jgi:hypothetical protein